MIEITILVCVLIAVFYLWTKKRPNNFPPGPPPVPFFGNIFQLPKGHLYPSVERWAKQYGPIIGLSAGSDLIIMVTGVDHIIAALRKEEFQGRPTSFSILARSYGKNLGLFFGNGDQWQSTRKFVVRQLRAFGKNEKESVIADEISQLMNTFKDGSTIKGTGIFGLSAVNVIWMIIANKRIDLNEERSRKFLQNLFEVFRQGNTSGGDILNIFPLLRFFSPTFKFSMKINWETKEFIQQTIQEHREILDPNNPLDLIDHYLVEMEKFKSSPNQYFTEEDLIMVGQDLFTAGAESTSNGIEFVLLYMILYPNIQKKMQDELDLVLGRTRKPVLSDKTQLHYTMAVMTEVERINSVVPTNVPHVCTQDTTFGGYFIPKGATISTNLRSLGHDPKYWKNPEEFNPGRFINAEGKYTRLTILHTFGIGSRVCVGEEIARNTTFLFITNFFEKYSISLPTGEAEPSTIALPGFTSAPPPFKITLKSRY